MKAAAFASPSEAIGRPSTCSSVRRRRESWPVVSLVPRLAMRLTHFGHLVDISRIDELVGIDLCDGEVRIGAATPHAFVGIDDEVADSVPLLSLATPYIGHFQIRNRGTLGGAIAHADPRRVRRGGAGARRRRWKRCPPAAPRYPRERVLHRPVGNPWHPTKSPPGAFPVWGAGSGFAVEEFARRHGISPSPVRSRSSWMRIAREPVA